MSVQVAKAELDKIVGWLRAFQDAQAVLDVLANIEQVTSETNARLDAVRAELVAAEDKLRVARETSGTLLSHAKSMVAEAEAAGKAAVESAKEAADKLRREADDELSAIKTEIADKRAELDELAPLVASAQAELDDINGKLLAAKEAYRKALED